MHFGLKEAWEIASFLCGIKQEHCGMIFFHVSPESLVVREKEMVFCSENCSHLLSLKIVLLLGNFFCKFEAGGWKMFEIIK